MSEKRDADPVGDEVKKAEEVKEKLQNIVENPEEEAAEESLSELRLRRPSYYEMVTDIDEFTGDTAFMLEQHRMMNDIMVQMHESLHVSDDDDRLLLELTSNPHVMEEQVKLFEF
ncbi:unnamed protein product [Caenorhabditis bovis]|uniref:Uncharacterized protein n=1 Tax=Caenorhabditis bovis TaxID=2654633 RepID=A0A8S1FCA6_9PELO|nr:unnamed protein product [Caenorhabditis bovis]